MFSKNFMAVGLLCSVVSLIFTIISLISTNKTNNAAQDLDWGHGHDKTNGVNSDIYIGVFELSIQNSNNDEEISQRIMYHSSSCNVTFCRTCHHYMPIVIGFLVAFIVMTLITMCSDFARFSGSGNSPMHQMIGVGCSLSACVLGLVSLIVFAASCMKKVKEYVNSVSPTSFSWTYGSAFGLLAVSVCLMFIDMIFNALVGTGEEANGQGPNYGQVNNNANPAAADSAPAPTAAAAAPADPEKKEIAMTEA